MRIDIESLPVNEGDLILLMTDGVMKAFHPMEAADLVKKVFYATGDISAAARELAGLSRSRGSSDDITVLLVEIPDE